MTEMTGIIPVRDCATSDAATNTVIRMIVDRFANTEWIYSLAPDVARRPDRPIYFTDMREVPIRIWVAIRSFVMGAFGKPLRQSSRRRR